MPDKSRSNRLNNFLLLRAYFSRVFIGVPPCMMNRLNQNRFRAAFNLKQCSLCKCMKVFLVELIPFQNMCTIIRITDCIG